MEGTTYLEKEKKDTSEMAQILNRVPENKKESVLMLVTGYVLASEEQKLRTGQGGGGVKSGRESIQKSPDCKHGDQCACFGHSNHGFNSAIIDVKIATADNMKLIRTGIQCRIKFSLEIFFCSIK